MSAQTVKLTLELHPMNAEPEIAGNGQSEPLLLFFHDGQAENARYTVDGRWLAASGARYRPTEFEGWAYAPLVRQPTYVGR